MNKAGLNVGGHRQFFDLERRGLLPTVLATVIVIMHEHVSGFQHTYLERTMDVTEDG